MASTVAFTESNISRALAAEPFSVTARGVNAYL
jgi:hypothetical protein